MKLKNLAGMILVGAVLTGGGAAFAADNQADWTTTLSVKLQLLEKLGTDSLHVDVDSVAGDLTLTGTVNKRETRELAEAIAKSVPSVKGVKNDILLAASEANPSKTSVAAGETEAELKDAAALHQDPPGAGRADGLGRLRDRHRGRRRRGHPRVRARSSSRPAAPRPARSSRGSMA